MSRPVTNHELAALLEEADFDRSHAALARRINHAASIHHGLRLQYDGASVYWWLRGRCPEQPAPELLAHVLSQRLHRPVDLGDLGFPKVDGQSTHDGLKYPDTVEESVRSVTSLCAHLKRRSAVPPTSTFGTAAAVEAGWRWSFDPPDVSVTHQGSRQVRSADVEALRACRQQFTDLDKRHGGGHARTFLADFLTRDVGPLLEGDYTDAIGRDLFQVAAELTCSLAFMFYDTSDHGRAQRAFIQSLRLAKAAGDAVLGAHVLANIATQAIFLNKAAEAVRLARAALDGAGKSAPAVVVARLNSTAATAHAMAGDVRCFHAAIDAAEAAIGQDDGHGPTWAAYFTPAHLAGTAIRSLLDLGLAVEALHHARQALDVPIENLRTAALHTALVATAYAKAGYIDQAALLGQQAALQAARVRSTRVTARIGILTDLMAEHTAIPEASAFLNLAREYLPAPSDVAR